MPIGFKVEVLNKLVDLLMEIIPDKETRWKIYDEVEKIGNLNDALHEIEREVWKFLIKFTFLFYLES